MDKIYDGRVSRRARAAVLFALTLACADVTLTLTTTLTLYGAGVRGGGVHAASTRPGALTPRRGSSKRR